MNGKISVTRVVVIGLDGVTFEVIDPLIAQGELPNLKRMMTNGSRAILQSVVPPYSPPAWISMLTGKNPGKHGIFHFLKRKGGSYDLEVASFRDVRENTLFSILAREGLGSGAMNIPMTYPPPDRVRGFFVSGIPVPPDPRSCASPPAIQEVIQAAGYEVDYDFRGFDPNREEEEDRWGDYQHLLDRLIEIERKRAEIFLNLARREELPLLFTVISLTDRVQHYFWRFTDPQHRGYSEEGNRRFGDAVRRAYVVADEILGQIVEACGDDVAYFVVSDHGFGPHYGDFHLNGWLVQNGFIKMKRTPRWTLKRGPLRHVLARLGAGFVASLLPGSIGARMVCYPGRKRHPDRNDVVWSKTKAFASMYGIRVNLKGREPGGIVEAGKAYQDLTREIAKALEGIVNPMNGKRLLTECIAKEEVFSGPHLDGSPDLFLDLAGISFLPTENWSIGETCILRKKCPFSGTHRIEGIFIAGGPPILRGKLMSPVRIMDILPSILYLFDIPIPRDIDGNVILEAMVEKRPVRLQASTSEEAGEGKSEKAYSEEEEDQITENLKGMGYI